MALRRRGIGEGLNAWPGYVDALSTLLMVIIFVLLVFVLAQAFLSVALSGRDRALDRLNRQMTELSDMLSLERGRSAELRLSIANLNRDLQATTTARDTLAQQLAALRAEELKLTADRDTLKSERDKLTAQLSDSNLQLQSAQSRAGQLQAQVGELAKREDAAAQEAASVSAQLAETRRILAETSKRADTSAKQAADTATQLADAQKRLAEMTARAQASETQAAATATQLSDTQKRLAEVSQRADASAQQLKDTLAQLAEARQLLTAARSRIDEMQRQAAELDRTVKADRETIEAKLSDLAKMAEQVRALTALRDELEKQAQEAAARATTEEERRQAVAAQLADEKKFGDSAKAEIALLNSQVEQLRAQLASVGAALEISEKSNKDKDVQIANLGARLNSALAQKVEELQQFRSDFFGQLRRVLANRPGIQIVGDRFVFQSEVLFPVGSADLSVAGWEQIKALASTLLDISKEIPPNVNWILRVDGHADRQPVQSDRFPSNWELSAARAITVVKLLIAAGVPADRLAATAFGDTKPLDAADTPEGYAKNRRIELRLTDR
jgi:chemotaxis protein MotB